MKGDIGQHGGQSWSSKQDEVPRVAEGLPKQSSRHFYQKKRGVHKISARHSGAGNGCANFMGAWHFWFFLLENLHAHKIPPFRGGF